MVTGVSADVSVPLVVIDVTAWTPDGFATYEVGTDAQGVYQMSNVVPGSYKVEFLPSPSDPAYVSQRGTEQSQ